MSAVLKAQEPSARYLAAMRPGLVEHFDLTASAPGGVARLRELILTLAVRGKLVPQDPSDEPASACLERIQISRASGRRHTGAAPGAGPSTRTAGETPFPLPNGWAWACMSDVAQSRLGKMLDKAKNSGQPYPYLRNTNVQWGRFELDDIKLIKLESHEVDEYRLQPGDLLVCEGGEPGRCAIWADAGREMYFQKALHRVRPEGGVSSSFLALCLEADARSGRLSRHFTGATIKHLAGQQLEKYALALPPVTEQTRIVARVAELMRLCDALEAKNRLEDTQHAQLLNALLGTLTDSASAEELATNWRRVAAHFDLLLDRPEAVDALEQTMLQLAVRGSLLPGNPDDEPVSELLTRIRIEKDSLAAAGKIKHEKPATPIRRDEVPHELPAKWQWVRLGDVAKKITDGTHHSPANFAEGDFKYLSAKNIKSWGIDLSDVTYVPAAVHQEIYSRCDPEFGDILYIKDGATTGVLTINTLKEQFSLLSSVGVIKPSRGVTSEYLALVLRSPLFYQAMREGMTGVAITRVTLSKLKAAVFPLPPFPEQTRIVARFEQLRRLCADLRDMLANAQATQVRLADALVGSAASAD